MSDRRPATATSSASSWERGALWLLPTRAGCFLNRLTIAHARSGSTLRRPRTTSSGSVTATTRPRRPNFGGRPRLPCRSFPPAAADPARPFVAAMSEPDAEPETHAVDVDGRIAGEHAPEAVLQIDHDVVVHRHDDAGAEGGHGFGQRSRQVRAERDVLRDGTGRVDAADLKGHVVVHARDADCGEHVGARPAFGLDAIPHARRSERHRL